MSIRRQAWLGVAALCAAGLAALAPASARSRSRSRSRRSQHPVHHRRRHRPTSYAAHGGASLRAILGVRLMVQCGTHCLRAPLLRAESPQATPRDADTGSV